MPQNIKLLLQKLYSRNKSFTFFINEYSIAYDYSSSSKHIKFIPIEVKKDNVLCGHISLIMDDRLPKGEAFFGFLELIEDENIFDELWAKLKDICKKENINILKGPINGSIWHQYRCISESDGSDDFITEPISKPYYYKYLRNKKPFCEIVYSSGLRNEFRNLVHTLKSKNIEKLLSKNGFMIQRTETLDLNLLSQIVEISKRTFSKTSWGLTVLDDTEFLKLYSSEKINKHIDNIYLLYKENKLIGYCSTIREEKNLICKTICILPEFQGLGLGNALAYEIHKDAVEGGIQNIIYALVREDNQVHNFPLDGLKIFRKYSAFEFKIKDYE